ncbi:hypothetical protein Phi17218_021 [Cellulophaga phage phi17:2_18]|uniref:Uncharacterized protein n=2 Tax=Lightbulbvirus Cba172 TaxID=1918525 RepID=R9ZWI5_9CAUD|nr:hypothetical protein Phi17:2_gp021 [Cellulophaga phage phi17:2]AGO47554.1 hypothetical protein Phi17:2_gp021 [Cellulophaga phage phi17:2]ALO80424.1 hypothetical protein Phi17218_021 [Cellulophaga phage phi17:2_18]
MKIISKHKDYYDYLKGIYGEDPLLVYDRRESDIVRFFPMKKDDYKIRWHISDYAIHSFYICGYSYTLYEYDGKLYNPHSSEEIVKLKGVLEKKGIKTKIKKIVPIPTDINYKFRKPIIVKLHGEIFNSNSLPVLDTFSFAKVIDAKELYIKISTFLGWLNDNPDIEDNQTNKGKIISKGFDLKTSFRPKIKK